MAETMAETESSMGRESKSSGIDRDNLDRLLKIFNGGTGINIGTTLVRVIEAQADFDSTQETEYECGLADNIMAGFLGWKIRKDPKYKLMMEEGKETPRVAQHGRGMPPVATQIQDEAAYQERRVTLNDKKQPPKVIPHLTQRVKTFYMDHALTTDPILIPKLPTKSARARSMIGGTPITRETAIQLRNITLGSAVHSFSLDWRKSSLIFHDLSSKHAYGLQTSREKEKMLVTRIFYLSQNIFSAFLFKCGARAMVLCIQGYLIKNLLFAREYSSSFGTKSAVQPGEFERRKALCGAICDILWQAGNHTRCCVCLRQDEALFDTDYTYRVDGITEKLHLYEFKKFQDLEMFIKRHLSHFESESSNGCILFLYSVILSRTVVRILEDMNVAENSPNARLLTDNEQCLPSLLNLLLTGRAVQNFHNGNIVYDQDGNLLPMPLRGVKERSQVGLLYWDKSENKDEKTEIGSMLKTPKYPIWLTLVNGQYGMIFSLNRDLVSDWRVEHHFILFYFTGLSTNTSTQLTIDTRYTRRLRAKTGLTRKMEEEKIPPLEQCILTKWYGANIDWHGVFPYV